MEQLSADKICLLRYVNFTDRSEKWFRWWTVKFALISHGKLFLVFFESCNFLYLAEENVQKNPVNYLN